MPSFPINWSRAANNTCRCFSIVISILSIDLISSSLKWSFVWWGLFLHECLAGVSTNQMMLRSVQVLSPVKSGFYIWVDGVERCQVLRWSSVNSHESDHHQSVTREESISWSLTPVSQVSVDSWPRKFILHPLCLTIIIWLHSSGLFQDNCYQNIFSTHISSTQDLILIVKCLKVQNWRHIDEGEAGL